MEKTPSQSESETTGEQIIPQLPSESSENTDTNEDSIEYYTVVFYDVEGSIIKTESVASGKDATPPDEIFLPDNYLFIGWDRSFYSVVENLEIHTEYVDVSDVHNAICFSSVYTISGDEFVVNISLSGNVNICCLELEISFDKYSVQFSELLFCDGNGVIHYDSSTNKVYFVMACSENIQAMTDLCSLKFVAMKNEETADAIRIHVTDIASFDNNGNIVDETSQIFDGKINIKERAKQ